MAFNLPRGNANLSMDHDVRRACAMQLLTLLNYSPIQTDNTPRSFSMLVAGCDDEFWPHEPIEPLWPLYACLAWMGKK